MLLKVITFYTHLSVWLRVHSEDEDVDDETDEEPPNGLVEALFDEIERLRLQVSFYKWVVATYFYWTTPQLFESEMRSAVIEAETREEVMGEMEERIREMEKRFARRLMNEVRLSYWAGQKYSPGIHRLS
jgi:kinesin family member 20